ncbi:MAG TPA: dihydroorotate dehydrogenase-like protein [Anaerolineales bacterium]|nr:dihydroorotate dehydrogenase-like protein [Anaerolineales bacterium]
MVDLTTTYLGLKLKNPLVASPSPLSEKVENVKRLEEAGVSAVVMYSLFEEQITHESLELDYFLNQGTETFAESLTYFPEAGKYTLAPDKYVEKLEKTKKAVNIPVIGSLNGVSTGGWIKYARKIQEAGADALELNLYYLPIDVDMTSSLIEDTYLRLVSDIRSAINLPLAVKLAPFFTALPNFARRLVEAGADGLVLFNRFYQPDMDLENLEVVPNLVLSDSDDLRLPLRWIAILYGKVKADLALTSGVHTAEDLIKTMMAGANIAMTTSSILKNGLKAVPTILKGVEDWMIAHEYESVKQMCGSMSQGAVADPAAFERANYMKVLNSFNPGYIA